MITASRTHRHFNIRRKGFDLDKYLDENKDAPPAGMPTHFAGLHTEQEFRPWAVRLNDRIERFLDSETWVRLQIRIGNACGVFVTGTAIYLVVVLINAWVQGRFHFGAN